MASLALAERKLFTLLLHDSSYKYQPLIPDFLKNWLTTLSTNTLISIDNLGKKLIAKMLIFIAIRTES